MDGSIIRRLRLSEFMVPGTSHDDGWRLMLKCHLPVLVRTQKTAPSFVLLGDYLVPSPSRKRFMAASAHESDRSKSGEDYVLFWDAPPIEERAVEVSVRRQIHQVSIY